MATSSHAAPPVPPRPEFPTVAAYGASLSDVNFWEPYVKSVMARHGLDWRSPSAGFVGTFPTLLVGDHVVKLFGERFDGGNQHHGERSLLRVLAADPRMRVPRLIADGALYDDGGWRWPYLVMSRMAGVAWRDAGLPDEHARGIACQLGEMTRQLHGTEPPIDLAQRTDPLLAHRAGAQQRHRRWGSLPSRLIDQIPEYIGDFAGPRVRRLIHADLNEDHIFVSDLDGQPRFAGVIDWADAAVTDPYYELVALHLDAFRGAKSLLSAFLTGYGWRLTSDFAWRAMVATLLHQFDLLGPIADVLRLREVDTLTELADKLWCVA